MSHKYRLATATRMNMTDKGGAEIRRIWGDLDVVDAKSDLRVFISQEDIEKATRKDPAACVFAQACLRTFGAKKVLFFRTVAYIELPDENGKRHVERFIMNESMRDLLNKWDRGESVIPDGGFLLRAPSLSSTLSSELRRRRDRAAREHQRSLEGFRVETQKARPEVPLVKAKEETSKSKKATAPAPDKRDKAALSPKTVVPPAPASKGIGQGKGRYRDDPILIDAHADPVRNGAGSVHFTRAGLRVARTAGMPIDVRPEQGGPAS